jgi:omega-6 fatty acid desaturase (delta-12 desaturase)
MLHDRTPIMATPPVVLAPLAACAEPVPAAAEPIPAAAEPIIAITGGPRSGPALIAATRPFEDERPWTSRRLLLSTLITLGLLLVVAATATWWPVQVLAGLLAGLVQVRLFIFYHDALHGAIFRKAPLAQLLMTAVGYYLLAVRSVWQETHDYHHQNNAKLVGSSIGSYPLLSVGMLPKVTPAQWRMYRIIRHPLVMIAGPVTIFLVGMVWSAFRRDPARHWQGILAAGLHLAALVALTWWGGWRASLCVLVLPDVISMAIGSYLFYAQHNFPDVKLSKRSTWSFTNAALRSSSMFDMSPMMHWFTGNIGYHHVHHLNHRIPFYRLREAMQAIPELQQPGRTSWSLRDIRGCLSIGVWDPGQDRMLTYAEVARLPAA